MYHIGISRSQIKNATIAILPGDPKRVPLLAKYLDANAYELADKREYNSWLAQNSGIDILVISTGMGSPSTIICLEELAMLGIKKFIRIGTTGSIQEHINIGEIILTQASVRLDGASSHYAPIEYPAVADFELLSIFYNAGKLLNQNFHLGITCSTDTFWPAQERYENYSGYVLKRFKNSLTEWQKLNITNFEMESAGLYTWCQIMGLRAIAISVVVAKRTASEIVAKTDTKLQFKKIIDVIEANIKAINELKV